MKTAMRLTLAAVGLLALAAPVRAQNGAIGTWELTTVSPEGTFTSQMEIRQNGDALVAVAKSERGEREYDSVTVNGSRITLVLTISYNGTPMTITYRGEVNGAEMSGDADFGGLASGGWSASRK